MISIVTPWLNHPELVSDYETAARGAQVVIVDNGSEGETAALLNEMVGRLGNGSRVIRNETNHWFSAANNQGLAVASNEVVVFLNNDVLATGEWLKQAEADCGQPDKLSGNQLEVRQVCGQNVVFVSGWCVGARRETWDRLGGWDAEAYPLPYWEDVDLSWRAVRAGLKLNRTFWSLGHKLATTSGTTPEAFSHIDRNAAKFSERVRLICG